MEKHKVYTDPKVPPTTEQIEEDKNNRWYYAPQAMGWCKKCNTKWGDCRRDKTEVFCCKSCFT